MNLISFTLVSIINSNTVFDPPSFKLFNCDLSNNPPSSLNSLGNIKINCLPWYFCISLLPLIIIKTSFSILYFNNKIRL